VQAPKEEEQAPKEQLTEAQEHERREKAILYLRHRLQKGFLTRDQTPQEEEMDTMNGFFEQLEGHKDLEPSIIRATKVHKVLKAIVKLTSIPKEEEYNFKKRSATLLEIWNKRMETDGDVPPQSATEAKPSAALPEKEESAAPQTNGAHKIEDESKEGAEKISPVTAEKAEEAAEKLDQKVEEAETPAVKDAPEAPKDVAMSDAPASDAVPAPAKEEPSAETA
jgi:hypothetical protein